MKTIAKKIIVSLLGAQVRRLFFKYNPQVIVVAGSIGKTSTKRTIARVLSKEKRVQYQKGNYNDIVSVPLVVFGHSMPSIWNVYSWIKIYLSNEWQILHGYPYDVVVLELGTDGPRQIEQFRNYIHAHIAVITAVTKEHMEYFESIEAVAEEEFSLVPWSDVVFVNKDLMMAEPSSVNHQKILTYGRDRVSNYQIINLQKKLDGYSFSVSYEGKEVYTLSAPHTTLVQLYAVLMASVIAQRLGMSISSVQSALNEIESIPGRMQILHGIHGSLIIDDSYNASPEAVRIALSTLYEWDTNKRIAILGMMNELGDHSKEEHLHIGEMCDPRKLDHVVTIGRDAHAFLAPAARAKGCKVYEAKSAHDAGTFVASLLSEETVVLVKGSQNGVFAEEAIKPLLKDKADITRLVRQSPEWLSKKGIRAR